MENAIQVAAIATPVLLAAMGLYLTFWPPARTVSKWKWSAAFLAIGVIAVFTEIFDRNSRENEIIAQVTGDYSFCHVDITFTTRDEITFVLLHSGTYTIPDVTVQLQYSADVKKLLEEAKAGNTTLSDDAVAIMKRATKTIYAGTVSSQSFTLLPTVPYRGERRNFFVYITARNGLYREPITVMRGSDGKDVVDNHLFKSVGDKYVEIWHQ